MAVQYINLSLVPVGSFETQSKKIEGKVNRYCIMTNGLYDRVYYVPEGVDMPHLGDAKIYSVSVTYPDSGRCFPDDIKYSLV